jgi:diacylglycerol kinase family enzyme
MGAGRPITIVFNRSSGSARDKGAQLEDAIARAALPATVVRVDGSDVVAAAERAAAAGHILVAAGGDGTVSSIAAVAVNTASVFGVIPLGTLNHFARDAGIPTDVDRAIATVGAGHTRQLDVGDVNGVPFVNNTSLGLYPRLVIHSAPGVDRFEFAMLPIRALAGRLGPAAKFESFNACEITIDTRRAAVDLAVDGELRSATPPIRYTLRPRALTALVPEAA